MPFGTGNAQKFVKIGYKKARIELSYKTLKLFQSKLLKRFLLTISFWPDFHKCWINKHWLNIKICKHYFGDQKWKIQLWSSRSYGYNYQWICRHYEYRFSHISIQIIKNSTCLALNDTDNESYRSENQNEPCPGTSKLLKNENYSLLKNNQF